MRAVAAVLLVVLGLLVGCAAPGPARPAEDGPPNIVVLFAEAGLELGNFLISDQPRLK